MTMESSPIIGRLVDTVIDFVLSFGTPSISSPLLLEEATTPQDDDIMIPATTTTKGTRFLRNAGSGLQLSSAATTAWYCLLFAVVLPIVGCLFWCWYQKYRGHRRALDALERESQLSRIEANIQAFSKAEKNKRLRLIRSIIREQLTKVTQADWNAKRKERQEQGDEESASSSSSSNGFSCSICLEDFRVGDSVARSSDSMCCHQYHEECIISWLVARQHAFCPYCRRPFVCLPAHKASVACSHDLTTVIEDDLESTRMESSSVMMIGQDDRTVADTLDVVVEDDDVPTTMVGEDEAEEANKDPPASAQTMEQP